MPAKVHVMTLPKRGRCLFATADIRIGEEILVCPVVVIPANEVKAVRATVLGKYVFDWPAEKKSAEKKSADWNRCCVALGDASLLNHSDNPNADWDATLADKDKIRLVAITGIDAGTEVTIDYQWPRAMKRGFIEQGRRA